MTFQFDPIYLHISEEAGTLGHPVCIFFFRDQRIVREQVVNVVVRLSSEPRRNVSPGEEAPTRTRAKLSREQRDLFGGAVGDV